MGLKSGGELAEGCDEDNRLVSEKVVIDEPCTDEWPRVAVETKTRPRSGQDLQY
jgi:hypothetical protein